MIEIRHRQTDEVLYRCAAASLEGAALTGASLSGAALRGALLRGADLAGADLAGADLREANLVGAKLDGADLRSADLEAAHLETASMEEAALAGARLAEASLFCARLRNAGARGAQLSGANLYQAVLHGTCMAGGKLARARVELCDAQGADFARADLSDANLRGADLAKSSLENANLAGADLSSANLEAARLHGADLTRAILRGANLAGVDLARTNVRDSLFDNCTRWPQGFDPLSYQRLDAGPAEGPAPAGEAERVPLSIREARLPLSEGTEWGRADAPTIEGVAVAQLKIFPNERRTLLVSYDQDEPPGTLGYTVLLKPGCSVGDHYHHRREERIILLQGRVRFTLQDFRPGSPSAGLLNLFTLSYPGVGVRVPTGVAHTIVAEDDGAVLEVLASCDYDPSDDVHVTLPR